MIEAATEPVASRPIYLDYQATTPTDPRVVEKMLPYMTTFFGNASSVDHSFGDEAEAAVTEARRQVAELVGASPRQVTFTSGATESINLAIQGRVAALAYIVEVPRIALTPVEHKAVLDTCEALAKQGRAELIFLQVDSLGRLDLTQVERTCQNDISLLCVMAANNEIGNIYPVREIGEIARRNNVPFLCDGSQAVGKIPIDFHEAGITYLAISGHKLYGPKGIGALVARPEHKLRPVQFGGSHEGGLRSGTLNVPGIVGLGEACRLRRLEMVEDEMEVAQLRDQLQNLLSKKIPQLKVIGDTSNRLAGNLCISIPGIPNKAVIARVRDRLAISTGAACSSGIESPSHVVKTLNLADIVLDGLLRISVGKYTGYEDVMKASNILVGEIQAILKII